MHPDDISGSFDTAFAQPISVPSHQTTQYGFPAPTSSCGDPREVGASGIIDGGCAARLNTIEEVPAMGTPPSDEPPPKKDAVRKYEAMGTSPTRDTVFRVKKMDWGGRKDSPISRFPNGMSIALKEVHTFDVLCRGFDPCIVFPRPSNAP